MSLCKKNIYIYQEKQVALLSHLVEQCKIKYLETKLNNTRTLPKQTTIDASLIPCELLVIKSRFQSTAVVTLATIAL